MRSTDIWRKKTRWEREREREKERVEKELKGS